MGRVGSVGVVCLDDEWGRPSICFVWVMEEYGFVHRMDKCFWPIPAWNQSWCLWRDQDTLPSFLLLLCIRRWFVPLPVVSRFVPSVWSFPTPWLCVGLWAESHILPCCWWWDCHALNPTGSSAWENYNPNTYKFFSNLYINVHQPRISKSPFKSSSTLIHKVHTLSHLHICVRLQNKSELYNPYIDYWPQKNGGLFIITYNYISVLLYKNIS